ncbi:DUF3883 domain-containing protein [Parvibaculum sp.]|uniref:DUF3883 domain-containing protein n=1 Tax=Parvibaculum sp. TaxID=2024848 RepID=UPI000C8D0FFF|nr:DUF3883 domain-containing protein [Parvibaculum sp.]MAB15399.1 hypothetical protein [Parvibaculum sp.]
MEPIIFVNIGWMKKYEGESLDDPLEPGNFGHFKSRGTGKPVGHEQWNFKSDRGWVYGYVPRSSGVNIGKLGALPGEKEIQGVLVVFIARDPRANQLKVVGWYRNATVKRSAEFSHKVGGNLVETTIIAKSADCFVLPVSDRDIVVPTAKKEKGGVGQSPIWYAGSHPELISRVRKLIDGVTSRGRRPSSVGNSPNGKSAPRNLDPESRLKVEKVAMKMAMEYFDNSLDVSKECKGWDIEADGLGGRIFVEVKGLSGSFVNFELTPNEYNQMKRHTRKYILFVVTNALSAAVRAHIFRYTLGKNKSGVWESEEGTILSLNERTGARGFLA